MGAFGILVGKLIVCLVIGGLGCPNSGKSDSPKSIQPPPPAASQVTYTMAAATNSISYVCSLDHSVTPVSASASTRVKVTLDFGQQQCADNMSYDAKKIATDKANCGSGYEWFYYPRPGDDPTWTAAAGKALTAEVNSICQGHQPDPNGTNQTAVAPNPIGNGVAISPVWNSDGSVDVDGSHYVTGRAFCQAQMPIHMGGAAASWDQSQSGITGKPEKACQLAWGGALWNLAFLPDTINQTSINHTVATAVGPGKVAVEGVTVFWDNSLSKYSGTWTHGLINAGNVIPYDHWTPIGSPLEY